jgi:hypothetical protein
MKTMMAAAATLALIAGQSAAATSDVAAATTAAPGAHARTVNYCDARQMRHGAGDRVRLHADNRCRVGPPTAGSPGLFGNPLLIGGVVAGA